MNHIKKLIRTNLNTIYPLIFSLTLFLLIPIRIEAGNVTEEYEKLIKTYENFIELEIDVFKDLTFTLSDSQIKTGTVLKLMLEDQLGRKWIFKFGDSGPKGPVEIYRLFKLFGLDAPEIHYKTLNINGKMMQGSIQKFIENQGTLKGVKPDELPQNCLDYLSKAYVFNWLVANHKSHEEQFIVAGNDKIKEILRVDNSIEPILGEDELKYDYFPVSSVKPPASLMYYYGFWKDYMSNKISLPLEEAYEFIIFISDFPDEFFKQLFSSMPDFNNKINLIIRRKHNLPNDFSKFYNDLLIKRGGSVRFSKKANYKNISDEICRKLELEIEKLKNEKLKLKGLLKKQQEIKAVVSYDAYKQALIIYKTNWLKLKETGKSLVELCDDALKKLEILESSETNKYEKEAVKHYIEEVKKIKITGKPSWYYTEINELVDVNPKE